jgi:hypothetical protein
MDWAGAMDLKAILGKRLGPQEIAMHFRKDLRQIVTIHIAMFQKLLFEDEELPLELADLFEDVGNSYLGISEQISEQYIERRRSQIE